MQDPTRPRRISRRELLLFGGQGAVLALLAACRAAVDSPSTPAAGATSTPLGRSTSVPPTSTASAATQTLTRSVAPETSLEVKIGQMLMVGFRGLTLENNPIAQDVRERGLGSVVLFDYDVPLAAPLRNVQSPSQLAGLTAALQASAPIPLLIAIDQEGGQVVRLKPAAGFPATLSEQALGKLNDLGRVRQNGVVIAKMLAAAGINLNLAPVVDLNINPDNPIIGRLDRSFSADPEVVARLGIAEIQAHHQYKVLTTLKHFPGHGSSRTDSHLGFVDVTDTWTRAELEPYRQIIAAGLCDAVMTAHIFNSRLDPDWPATLSSRIVTDLLRSELGWDGVVISDDLQMGAISERYGLELAVQRAILAGVDILAFANNLPWSFDPNIVAQIKSIILQAVKDGKLSEARIDQSYHRIMRLKAALA